MGNISTTTIETPNFKTFLNRSGEGNEKAILFLHGSGPGVYAYANWKYALSDAGETFDCLAPDLFGFGDSSHPETLPENREGWMNLWVQQITELIDVLKLNKVHVVGNSLGCSIALEMLVNVPNLIDKVVLMGPGGTPNTKISQELMRAKGFYDAPSKKKMKQIMSWFVYDITDMEEEIDSIADRRYEVAMRSEVRRSNASIFSTAALPVPETALRRIPHDIMLVHGRDDKVCSVESSYYLLQHLSKVQMHVFGECGHWTQLEKPKRFNRLILEFFNEHV